MMKKLKDKDSRDSMLLIFMGVIMIAFLVYLFIPAGKKTDPVKPVKKKPEKVNPVGKKPVKTPPQNVEPVDEESRKLQEINSEIDSGLKNLFDSINASRYPFAMFSAETLKEILRKFEYDEVKKLSKYSFGDLKDIATLELPEKLSGQLRFNLYLSLFLIKLQEEKIEKACESLPWNEFQKMIDFTPYTLINNELQFDYQLLPVLFYFQQMINRMDFYPEFDMANFFKERVSILKDLTDSKLVVKLRELLAFSESQEKYRIEWVEHDGFLGPDDKKSYPNLTIKTMNFLKQEYIILPDSSGVTVNQWLKDLYKADSGSIELKKLGIRNEDPTKDAKLQKIVYTPLKSSFIALFKEYDPMVNDELLNRIIALSMKKYHRSFIVISFSESQKDDESFKQALNAFGNYLKENKRSVLN